MTPFRTSYLTRLPLPLGTVWLLTNVAEAKGRQDLYTRQAPQVLQALRETALIQSVESSNRIEGVTVAPGRLRPLVMESVSGAERPVRSSILRTSPPQGAPRPRFEKSDRHLRLGDVPPSP
jgi:hypothetical protein